MSPTGRRTVCGGVTTANHPILLVSPPTIGRIGSWKLAGGTRRVTHSSPSWLLSSGSQPGTVTQQVAYRATLPTSRPPLMVPEARPLPLGAPLYGTEDSCSSWARGVLAATTLLGLAVLLLRTRAPLEQRWSPVPIRFITALPMNQPILQLQERGATLIFSGIKTPAK